MLLFPEVFLKEVKRVYRQPLAYLSHHRQQENAFDYLDSIHLEYMLHKVKCTAETPAQMLLPQQKLCNQ